MLHYLEYIIAFSIAVIYDLICGLTLKQDTIVLIIEWNLTMSSLFIVVLNGAFI